MQVAFTSEMMISIVGMADIELGHGPAHQAPVRNQIAAAVHDQDPAHRTAINIAIKIDPTEANHRQAAIWAQSTTMTMITNIGQEVFAPIFFLLRIKLKQISNEYVWIKFIDSKEPACPPPPIISKSKVSVAFAKPAKVNWTITYSTNL